MPWSDRSGDRHDRSGGRQQDGGNEERGEGGGELLAKVETGHDSYSLLGRVNHFTGDAESFAEVVPTF